MAGINPTHDPFRQEDQGYVPGYVDNSPDMTGIAISPGAAPYGINPDGTPKSFWDWLQGGGQASPSATPAWGVNNYNDAQANQQIEQWMNQIFGGLGQWFNQPVPQDLQGRPQSDLMQLPTQSSAQTARQQHDHDLAVAQAQADYYRWAAGSGNVGPEPQLADYNGDTHAYDVAHGQWQNNQAGVKAAQDAAAQAEATIRNLQSQNPATSAPVSASGHASPDTQATELGYNLDPWTQPADQWWRQDEKGMGGYVTMINPITGQPQQVAVPNTYNYQLPDTIDVAQDNTNLTPSQQGFKSEADYLRYKQSGGKIDARTTYNLNPNTLGAYGSGGSGGGGGGGRLSSSAIASLKQQKQAAQDKAMESWSQFLLDYMGKHPYGGQYVSKGYLPAAGSASLSRIPFSQELIDAFNAHPEQSPMSVSNPGPAPVGFTGNTYMNPNQPGNFGGPEDLNIESTPTGIGNQYTQDDPYYDAINQAIDSGYVPYNLPNNNITPYLDDDPDTYMPFGNFNGDFSVGGAVSPMPHAQQQHVITPYMPRRSPADEGAYPYYQPGASRGRGPATPNYNPIVAPPPSDDGGGNPWGRPGGGHTVPGPIFAPPPIGIPPQPGPPGSQSPPNEPPGIPPGTYPRSPFGWGLSPYYNRPGYEWTMGNNVASGSGVGEDYSNARGVYTDLQNQLGLHFGPELYGQLTDQGSLLVPSAQALGGFTKDQQSALSDYATSVLGWNFQDLLKESQAQNNRENVALPTDFK